MMQLSTRGRYATRIMIYLADPYVTTPARKQDIGATEEISADYVEQILVKLRAAGLVRSHRGAKGGFSLTRSPETITIADILRATEGPIAVAPCATEDCRRADQCPARSVWQEANDAITRIFSNTTLAEAMKRRLQERQAGTLTFEI